MNQREQSVLKDHNKIKNGKKKVLCNWINNKTLFCQSFHTTKVFKHKIGQDMYHNKPLQKHMLCVIHSSQTNI